MRRCGTRLASPSKILSSSATTLAPESAEKVRKSVFDSKESTLVSVNLYIKKAFINGRRLFGTPLTSNPRGYRTVQVGSESDWRTSLKSPPQDYFFDPDLLTDGAPPNDRGCRACGKVDNHYFLKPKSLDLAASFWFSCWVILSFLRSATWWRTVRGRRPRTTGSVRRRIGGRDRTRSRNGRTISRRGRGEIARARIG